MTNTTSDVLALARVRGLCDSGAAKAARQAARLSLAEVGRAIGASPTAVYRWEIGERRPHGENAVRYLQLLDQLLGGVKR